MVDLYGRKPMTRMQYAAAKIRLESMYPDMNHTSGRRSIYHNEYVGGSEYSKHLIGMADDYIFDVCHPLTPKFGEMLVVLGFWFKFYNDDDFKFHIQGLPPGKVADWWVNQEGDR